MDGMIECEPECEWAIREKDARDMPAAVRREKEGHLSLHVALNRPEASALAPDSRPYDGARCTPLELRPPSERGTQKQEAADERRAGAQYRCRRSTRRADRFSGRFDARIMAAKRPKRQPVLAEMD